jgi:hypothetical protein
MQSTHGERQKSDPHRLEIAMTTENLWKNAAISPASIDAIVRRARVERSEAMRAELIALLGAVKRLAASFRPTRQRTPQTRALA